LNVFSKFPEMMAHVGVPAKHLVHVGAHVGQEMPYYHQVGFEQITLVEPIPALAAKLRVLFNDVRVVECACASEPGTRDLHIMNITNLSTLVEPTEVDRVEHTIQVEARRLDEVAPDANVIVVDAQGLELDVLESADLSAVELAVVETCTVRDETMAAYYDDVLAYMTQHGFTEVDRWVRDYAWVAKWGRGTRPTEDGEIRDVVFHRVD
jgi:FkbM family methyltransferase